MKQVTRVNRGLPPEGEGVRPKRLAAPCDTLATVSGLLGHGAPRLEPGVWAIR